MLYKDAPFDPEEIELLKPNSVSSSSFSAFKAFLTDLTDENRHIFLQKLVGSNTIPCAKLSLLRPKLKFKTSDKFEINKISHKIYFPPDSTTEQFMKEFIESV